MKYEILKLQIGALHLFVLNCYNYLYWHFYH